jgi:hypothetical protein
MSMEYKEQKQRQFHNTIFMGSGEYSTQACDLLRKRVDDALSFLSGSQQAPMATDPKGSHERHLSFMDHADMVLASVVQDVGAALTGKVWVPAEGQELTQMQRAIRAQQFCRDSYGHKSWFIDALLDTSKNVPSICLCYEKTDIRFTYTASYMDIEIRAVEAGEE